MGYANTGNKREWPNYFRGAACPWLRQCISACRLWKVCPHPQMSSDTCRPQWTKENLHWQLHRFGRSPQERPGTLHALFCSVSKMIPGSSQGWWLVVHASWMISSLDLCCQLCFSFSHPELPELQGLSFSCSGVGLPVIHPWLCPSPWSWWVPLSIFAFLALCSKCRPNSQSAWFAFCHRRSLAAHLRLDK